MSLAPIKVSTDSINIESVDGYVRIALLQVSYDRKDSQTNYEAMAQIMIANTPAVLVDVRKIKSITNDAMTAVVQRYNGFGIPAMAVLQGEVDPATWKVFENVIKPEFEFKGFGDESEAVAWIKQFVD